MPYTSAQQKVPVTLSPARTYRGSAQQNVLVTLERALAEFRLDAVERFEAFERRLCVLRQSIDRDQRLNSKPRDDINRWTVSRPLFFF